MSDKKKPERPDIDYQHPLLDFPSGSGDPDCPKCRGRGVVPVMVDVGGGKMWPGGGTQDCSCVFKRDLVANVKRVWKVLLNVESVEDSELMGKTKQNLWITSSSYDFRRHLRFVAFRMGTKWDARVVADATLMTAWLSTASRVRDPDVLVEREGYARERPSEHFVTLVDLAVPFDLLILRLGIKAAANKEMANVLVEALNERELQGKPTWIVDSHAQPLGPGHLCYNEAVMEILDGFRRMVIEPSQTAFAPSAAAQQYRRPQQAPTGAAAPSAGAASPYTRRKGGMAPVASQRPATPRPEAPEPDTHHVLSMEDDGERGEPVPLVDDDDEFSVDALLADAHDPDLTAGGEGLLEPEVDGAAEVEELLSEFPTAEELGGNAEALPAWLRGSLTKEERIAAEREEKRQKRWKKNKGRGGDNR
jgi:hypothetical protein